MPLIDSVSMRRRMYALSTEVIGRAVSLTGLKVAGRESKRMMTRVSSVSPRCASSRLGSVQRPENDWTVVSSSTAPSSVTVWTLPPTWVQRILQTPELSRFSEHDVTEKNKAAVASKRGVIDESFTTLFHVRGSARKHGEAARPASRLLLFRRACSSIL